MAIKYVNKPAAEGIQIPPSVGEAKPAPKKSAKLSKVKVNPPPTIKIGAEFDTAAIENMIAALEKFGAACAKVAPAMAVITQKAPDGAEIMKHEKLFDVMSPKPMSNVGCQASQTVNMGNFNSLKIGVSVNVPCDISELDATFDFAKNWVDSKMQQLQEEVATAKGG